MDEGNDVFYMRARYYDAAAGRFLNEDPIGFAGGDMNLYAYVGGDPLTSIDPSGTTNQSPSLSAPRIGPYNTYMDTAYQAFMTNRIKLARYIVKVKRLRKNPGGIVELTISQLLPDPVSKLCLFAWKLAAKRVLADIDLSIDIEAKEIVDTQFYKILQTEKGKILLRNLGRAEEEGGFVDDYTGLYTTTNDVLYQLERTNFNQ